MIDKYQRNVNNDYILKVKKRKMVHLILYSITNFSDRNTPSEAQQSKLNNITGKMYNSGISRIL